MSELQAWRLCAAEHAATAFSGEGARRYGGRWSFPGVPAVYCSETRALSTLEVLAHVDVPSRLSRHEWVHISVMFPSELVTTPARVPESWKKYPHSTETQRFGSIWIKEASTPVLRLPSALVPGESNFLLNPAHPHFARLKIGRPEPFFFDPRLM